MQNFFLETPKKGRSKISAKIWPPVSEVLDPLVSSRAITQMTSHLEQVSSPAYYPRNIIPFFLAHQCEIMWPRSKVIVLLNDGWKKMLESVEFVPFER